MIDHLSLALRLQIQKQLMRRYEVAPRLQPACTAPLHHQLRPHRRRPPARPHQQGEPTVDGESWEDVKQMQSSIFVKIVEDDALAEDPRGKRSECVAPFDKCNREEDYDEVWADFRQGFG